MKRPARRPVSPSPLTVIGALVLVVAACGGSGASTAPSAATTPASRVAASTPTGAPATTSAPSAAATLAPTPAPSDGSTAGQVRTDAFGIEQVWVPAGSFTMGTSEAEI